jgi:hypothetical protein
MPRRSLFQSPAKVPAAVWMRRKAAASAREGKSEKIEWMLSVCMKETGCMSREARAAYNSLPDTLKRKWPPKKFPTEST